MKLSKYHQQRYGAWAGNPLGLNADPSRCAAVVSSKHNYVTHQCTRKRGYGPEQAYCKIHDPDAEAKREQESRNKYRKKLRQDALRYANDLYQALQLIEQGHNDPRLVAKEALLKFDHRFKKN